MTLRPALLAAMLVLCPLVARAELAISANDGKQLVKGEPATITPDSVSVIDLAQSPPLVIGTVAAPASMIGPPKAVAEATDHSFAIVTASQKVNPADPMTPADDDRVSVVDLADPTHPRRTQTVAAGPGASGISISPGGGLVLVAAKMGDAIHVFTLAGKRLTPAGKVDLGPGARPTDVVFAPDGRHAYAVAWGAGKVMELAVTGSRVARTGKDVATGRLPYGAAVTPDGRWLINTNVGGALAGGDHVGTLTMIDLAAHRLVLSLPVGKVPEHVVLSPDGRYAALVLANGAATSRADPRYDAVLGIVKVFAVEPGSLTEVARAGSCHWAQGAAWSDDGRLILQQCAAERAIQVFRFTGHALTRDATLAFESRPGAVSIHRSR